MKNARPLYIVCQVLKVLLIIIYKIQPPSSFFFLTDPLKLATPTPSKLPKRDDSPLLVGKRNLMLQKSDKS